MKRGPSVMSPNIDLHSWRPRLTTPRLRIARRAIVPGLLAALPMMFAFVATAVAAPIAVQIEGSAFHPATVTVTVGGSVTWTNLDPIFGSSATAKDGSFNTGVLSKNQSATVTFETVGTFGYYCMIDPLMVGTVIVTASVAPATDTASVAPPTRRPPDVTILVLALVFVGAALIGWRRSTRRAY